MQRIKKRATQKKKALSVFKKMRRQTPLLGCKTTGMPRLEAEEETSPPWPVPETRAAGMSISERSMPLRRHPVQHARPQKTGGNTAQPLPVRTRVSKNHSQRPDPRSSSALHRRKTQLRRLFRSTFLPERRRSSTFIDGKRSFEGFSPSSGDGEKQSPDPRANFGRRCLWPSCIADLANIMRKKPHVRRRQTIFSTFSTLQHMISLRWIIEKLFPEHV